MRLTLFSLVMGLGVLASADPLTVTSYDMLNGNGQFSGGSFNYWDLQYNGTGSTNVDNAALSGGVGDLTDGYVETQNWFAVENEAGTGPYVGWYDQDPTITFNFGGPVTVQSMTIHADDSDGAGGVDLPTGVMINGTLYDVDETLTGAEPKAITFTGLDLTGSSLEVQLMRFNAWVFVSEVTFDGEPVPEPATLAILGLGALALRKRRQA